MFTGIIETTGLIKEAISIGSNKSFWIESSISNELTTDESINHNGVCLTIEEIKNNRHKITAISETLSKTTIAEWKTGEMVNLERCISLNGKLNGHLVQGHVDAKVQCLKRKEKKGSWEFEFELPKKFVALMIEKGSVCINGISLTAFDVKKKSFRVAIIPYTYENTNMKDVKHGDPVNVEFDLIGKYIQRNLLTR